MAKNILSRKFKKKDPVMTTLSCVIRDSNNSRYTTKRLLKTKNGFLYLLKHLEHVRLNMNLFNTLCMKQNMT